MTRAQVIGARLRAVRHEAGMTLEEVRDATGGRYKPTALSNYERGERPVTIAHLLDLAAVYEVHPADLLPDAEVGA